MTATVHALEFDGSYAQVRVDMHNTEGKPEAYRAIFLKTFEGEWKFSEVRVRRDGKRGTSWGSMNGRFQMQRVYDEVARAGQLPA